MSKIQKRTITISEQQGQFIERKLAAGDYANVSEIFRDGLRALQQRDAAIEKWLMEEVTPAYDDMQANPDKMIPAKDAFAAIRHHAATKRED